MGASTTTADEISSAGDVQDLIRSVDGLVEYVKQWKDSEGQVYASAIEAIKTQMGEIRSELDAVSSRMNTSDEGLESGSVSSSEIVGVPVLENMALRVTHLERWVAKLDEKFKKDASMARKQFVISLVTLVAAAAFFGAAIWFGVGGL